MSRPDGDPIDDLTQFAEERRTRISRYAENEPLTSLSRQWLERSMSEMYVYNFDWAGLPIIQYPQDMVALQEIVWRTRPDLIIETGIARGGSLALSASLLALLDYCDAAAGGTTLDLRASNRRVLGIDIDIRAHNKAAVENHPLAHKIKMIEGSSTDESTIAEVRQSAQGCERVMVCLDSNHTHDHVLAELRAYAPLVTPSSYCIVFDTFVENIPRGFFADRPWNVGDNPMTAAGAFLADHDEFEVDREIERKLQITVAPGGFLRRRR
jgi:cephalosporin hydroxylase